MSKNEAKIIPYGKKTKVNVHEGVLPQLLPQLLELRNQIERDVKLVVETRALVQPSAEEKLKLESKKEIGAKSSISLTSTVKRKHQRKVAWVKSSPISIDSAEISISPHLPLSSQIVDHLVQFRDLESFKYELVRISQPYLKDASKLYAKLFHYHGESPMSITVDSRRPIQNLVMPTPSPVEKKGDVFGIEHQNVTSQRTNGMVVFMHPRSNTNERKLRLKLQYLDNSGELNEQDVIFWSNGDSYGMEMVNASPSSEPEIDTLSPFVTSPRRSLPGWQGRAPLWVPSSECRFELLPLIENSFLDMESDDHTTDESDILDMNDEVGKKPILVSCCAISVSSRKAAYKIVESIQHDIFRERVTSMSVLGGIPPLHIAAFHNNLEVRVKKHNVIIIFIRD